LRDYEGGGGVYDGKNDGKYEDKMDMRHIWHKMVRRLFCALLVENRG
jgi:hypothetical protein